MRAVVSATARLAVSSGLALLAAGCYDFGALGGYDAAASLPSDLAPSADLLSSSDPDGGSCSCGQGSNCVAGSCVVAPATCSLLSAMYQPDVAHDGVYWLNYNGGSHRVFCDMTTGAILCAKEVGFEPHTTRTRDGKSRSVNWTSSMSADEGSCSIWNVRGDDQRPFGPLVKNGKTTMSTCQALGFVADQYVPSCAYGMTNTDDVYKGTCGFTGSTDWMIYFNNCLVWTSTNGGCKMGGGVLGYWQPQGPMSNVGVISTADGSKKTVCTTR